MTGINPRVSKAASQVDFDAAQYTWIDLSDVTVAEEELLPLMTELQNISPEKMPLLFEHMAIIPPLRYWSDRDVMTLSRDKGVLTHTSWVQGIKGSIFSLVVTESAEAPDGIDVAIDMEDAPFERLLKKYDGDDKKAGEWIISNASHLLCALYYATIVKQVVTDSYSGTGSATNAKRARKGKLPMYEWKTIVIDNIIRERMQADFQAAKRQPMREQRSIAVS